MIEPVSVAYRLGQHGWSSFTLTIGDASIEVGPFGYCTDALGDLVRAALVIAVFGERAEATFDGEPREWRLIVERAYGQGRGPTDVRVAVTGWPPVDSSDGHQEGAHGAIKDHPPAVLGPDWKLVVVPVPPSVASAPREHMALFEAFTEADAFAKAVRTAAQDIFDENGIDGYNRAWLPVVNGFPLRALRALTEALSIKEPSVQKS